jgi:hypothetical protein
MPRLSRLRAVREELRDCSGGTFLTWTDEKIALLSGGTLLMGYIQGEGRNQGTLFPVVLDDFVQPIIWTA